VGAITFITALEGYVQISQYPSRFIGDFRFWATILQLVSLGIVWVVHELEHERSRVSSGAVLFYWLFYVIASAIEVRSRFLRNFTTDEWTFAFVTTNLILAIIVFVLELWVPKKQSVYRAVGSDHESPEEYANIFSLLSFGWFTPMMAKGYKVYLTQEDLWDLPSRKTCHANGDKLIAQFDRHRLRQQNVSIYKAMASVYGPSYALHAPLKLFSDSMQYLQPQFLRMLIDFVQSYRTESPQPPLRGFLIAVAMFSATLLQSVSSNQFMNYLFELALAVRTGLIANIYKKSLRLSNEGRSHQSTGDIVNLMAVDTQRISELARQGHQLWSSPFQITLCIISLCNLLGWAGFAGVGVMCLMVPLNAYIARLMKTFQKKQMKNKDERTRLTTEILNNIKSIKLYSWTVAFAAKLAEIRNNRELKTLRKIGATQAASRFCWNSTPFLVSVATFTLYVTLNKAPLSIDLAFPALTLFNYLTMPLTQLPNVISSAVESTVAAKRLSDFLTADEIQDDAVQRLPPAKSIGELSVQVKDASFTWGGEYDTEFLQDINYESRKGMLSCIVGRVGSGKSSLLQAVLGDLRKTHGEVMLRGSVAYVAQNAWIMNSSVRNNVLFGHRWDPEFYQKTIHACALIEDLAMLPDGDMTEVGEKGISLSGGQKARLQLARAVYARADIYLLDDILSAVDQHVGRHIINEVVGPKGLLRGKTRVLATNAIPVLRDADHIAMMENGQIKEQGTYVELMSKGGEIAALIRFAQTAMTEEPPSPGPSSTISTPIKSGAAFDSDDETLPPYEERDTFLNQDEPRASISSLRRASISSFTDAKKYRESKNDEEMALLPAKKTRQTKEVGEKGKVKWKVYVEYARACNIAAIGVWFFTILAVQSLQVSSSVWLKTWAESNQSNGGNANIAKNVGVYFALGMSGSAMVVVQTMIMWIYCSIQASKVLHERMAHAMFRSPMSFFETTPVGRILNRFSADLWRVDEAIGRSFSEFFGNLAKTAFTLGVICTTTPVFIAILLPLGALYSFIQRYYLRSNRELKRLESISRSPIYAHFGESLGGISTIRAFQQQERWAWENEHRVDNNMKAAYPSVHANRWLGIRLELLGALVVFMTATLSILNVVNGGTISAGLIGLTMSYALQITQALNWMVRLSVEVETNIVSVERVLEYANLPSEAAEIIPGHRPSPTWPPKGAIDFSAYSMRYRPGLELSLKNISLSFKPREKIGVVGRTGAGKSSLTLSLFRIVEADSGNIEIDGVDTSSIGLADLRNKLAIIPQDAALFQGTIRDNLDPSHIRSDADLWTALSMFFLFLLCFYVLTSGRTRTIRSPHLSNGRRPRRSSGRNGL
jgi:ATP-binding cassette, subfamily C (CFTR/MRP), member 1